jgi:hypothetical protein
VNRNRKLISSKRPAEKAQAMLGRGCIGQVEKIAKSVKDQMFHLADLAAKGNQLAAREIYIIPSLGTHWLDYLARKKPDLFLPIAASKMSWPMMWGAHPEVVQHNKAFAEYLKLGSGVRINFSHVGKPFSLKVPANQVAMHLLRLAQALRRAPIEDWDVYEWGLLGRVGRFSGSPSNYSVAHDAKQLRDLEGWGQHKGKRLPPLSRGTVSEWKPAMRELFWLVYGENFDEHPHLQKLKRAVMAHAKDGSGKQGPGVVREAMLKKVLQAVHSIAPLD